MALPPPGERKKRPPKGKSKSRKYALVYCNYTKDSADETNHRFMEISSTSVSSAHTALVKAVKEQTGNDKIGKPDVVLIEATLIQKGQTLESTLGLDEDEDETEDD